MSWAKFSMRPGTRIIYVLRGKRRIGRFIHRNGAYFWFMAGQGKFSLAADRVIQLYEQEFDVL